MGFKDLKKEPLGQKDKEYHCDDDLMGEHAACSSADHTQRGGLRRRTRVVTLPHTNDGRKPKQRASQYEKATRTTTSGRND